MSQARKPCGNKIPYYRHSDFSVLSLTKSLFPRIIPPSDSVFLLFIICLRTDAENYVTPSYYESLSRPYKFSY